MSLIFIATALIVAFFLAALAVQRLLPWIRCAVCVAVSATWILLLAMYWWSAGSFDPTIIAVLMGGSVVGIYGMWERRVSREWHAFRLPLLLTLILGAYALLGRSDFGDAALLVGGTWTLFFILSLLRRHPNARAALDRLIACCRDW
jgi:hypothetical protein